MSEDARNIVGNLFEIPSIRGEINPVALLAGVLTEGSVITEQKLKYTTGSFAAAATKQAEVIEHGLGKLPRLVIFYTTSSIYNPTYSSSDSTRYDQILFSRTLISKRDDGTESYSCNYIYLYSTRFAYYASASTSSTSYMAKNSVSCSASSGTKLTNIPSTTCCRNFTETTFTTPSYLYKGKNYTWYAFE